MKKIMIICIVLIAIIASFSGCNEEKKSEKTNSEIAIEFINEIQQDKLNIAYDYFSSLMKSQFTINQFQSSWETITSLYGSFETIKNTSESVEEDYEIVFVNCSFSYNSSYPLDILS